MAIAIATVMVAAGLSVVPPAAALTASCDADFEIADSELLAEERSLDPGQSMEGHEDVDADNPENLTVQLETQDDELTWQVFFEHPNKGCIEYTKGDCNGENVISTRGASQTCTLNAPDSGTRDYFVVYKNTEDAPADSLKFTTWSVD